MKKSLEKALSDLDPEVVDAVLQARGEKHLKTEKKDITVRTGKRAVLIAVSAALVIAAAVIPIPFLMNKTSEPVGPSVNTATKTESNAPTVLTAPYTEPETHPSAVTGHSFAAGKERYDLPQKGSSSDRLSYSGLHSFVYDGKTYLFFDEDSALYSVDNSEFFGGARRAAGAWNGIFWERFIETGVYRDGYFYYGAGNRHCYLDPEYDHGVVRRNIVSGEDEWYIHTEYAVVGMYFSGDRLYLEEKGLFGYTMEEENLYIATIRIYCADLSSGDFSLVLDTGLEYASFYERDGELTLHFGKSGREYLMDLDGNVTEFETSVGAEIEGKKYRYSPYNFSRVNDKTFVYEITEDGEVAVLEDDAPYPMRALILGDTLDSLAVFEGKIVAVREYSLLLIDPHTGAETVLLTNICRESEGNPNGAIPEHLFSKTAVGDKLYFVDNTARKLYVFEGGKLISEVAV